MVVVIIKKKNLPVRFLNENKMIKKMTVLAGDGDDVSDGDVGDKTMGGGCLHGEHVRQHNLQTNDQLAFSTP